MIITSEYTGLVTDGDFFKSKQDYLKIPDHLRNTGFSEYLRKALIETLRENRDLYAGNLNNLAVVNPEYKFIRLVGENQRVNITTILDSTGQELKVKQIMKNPKGQRLASLDEFVVPCGERGRIERGVIYPQVLDKFGRLYIQELAKLRAEDFYKSDIHAHMVVASADYTYHEKFDGDETVYLKSKWGDLIETQSGLRLTLNQELSSKTTLIAECKSQQAFRGKDLKNGFQEEIKSRINGIENKTKITPEMFEQILIKYKNRKDKIELVKQEEFELDLAV